MQAKKHISMLVSLVFIVQNKSTKAITKLGVAYSGIEN